MLEAGLIYLVVAALYYPVTLLLPSEEIFFPLRWRVWMLGYICGIVVAGILSIFSMRKRG
jgi:hypothetical protein